MKNSCLNFHPKCSPSCIGSLPNLEPRLAVGTVFRYIKEMPFWPQLPKRDYREGMLFQFIENITFLEARDKSIGLKDDWSERLEKFFEAVINKDLDFFAIGKEYASGLHYFLDFLKDTKPSGEFLKGQVTGPFTFVAGIKAPDGNSLLFDEQLLDAVVSGLAMKAAWQVREFKRLGKRAIIFIDEPYLACFGSGFSPLNRGGVIEIINRLIERTEAPDTLFGLHCCSNTDWSMLLDTDIDIISFDAFSYFDRFALYPQELKAFLARGGAIAWGIVPTTEFNAKISVDDLIARFEEGLSILVNKGLDKEKILDKSLITPSCGMGSLSPQVSEQVLKLLAETSQRINERFIR